MQKNHLMLDVETMGVNSNAPIIQLGACLFDSQTGEILQTFCQNINLEDSILNYGLQKDQSTMDWWKEQRQDILEDILTNNKPFHFVMSEFSKFLSANVQYKETPIWSHATFDFPLVQNHLKLDGMKTMNHKMAYDIRTLTGLSGIDLNEYDWNKGKTHNALDDCIFQVNYCVDAMRILRHPVMAVPAGSPLLDLERAGPGEIIILTTN